MANNSPCKKECKLGKNKICLACNRTLTEIGQWGMMKDSDRMATMKQIKGKTSTHNCPECASPTYCAISDGKSLSACWCRDIPITQLEADYQTHCLCRNCLKDASKDVYVMNKGNE